MRVIGDLSRLAARRNPSKVALMMGDRRLTYAELDAQSNQLARALIGRGVRIGDRVAILAQNRLDYAVITQAAAKSGAILVPINFRLVAAEIKFLIANCSPKVLFLEEDFFETVSSVLVDVPAQPDLILLPAEEGSPAPRSPNHLELMSGQPVEPVEIDIDPESAATIIYTSGTTGTPKGVMYSHAGFFRLFISNIVELDITRDDVMHMAMPLFHNAGLNGALNSMMMIGASGVVHRGSFTPQAILGQIEKYRITAAHWVPTMLAMLCEYDKFDQYDVSSLKKIYYGGMPIELSVLRRSEAKFSAKFYQLYGVTECGTVTVLLPDDHVDHSQTTGREAFNADTRVVDEQMRDVGVGEVGEVIVRSAGNGMLGYWNNPAATADLIRDGWIFTGDLARIEEDTLLTIVGRRKELIISGSECIYPREVEIVLSEHPAIHEVTVFGIPDEKFGEKVCAALSLRSGASVTEEELEAFCVANMARYKRPRAFEFHKELPKNSSGKIAKKDLRAVHWAARDRKI